MVEGLTSFNAQLKALKDWPRISIDVARQNEDLKETLVRHVRATNHVVTSKRILVTPAERPHPFPSRTRKLSSPAPKILRGQPLGKIGRRQDPF